MEAQSPIKDAPLRTPGQSLDEEITLWRSERLAEYLVPAIMFFGLALMEWVGYLTNSPRHPIIYTALAAIAIAVLVARVFYIRGRLRNIRLGLQGERVVGQFLENFRRRGGHVFHDIPGPNFNVDHVLICPQGVFVIETKTHRKVGPDVRVTLKDGQLLIGGYVPDRDPVVQATAAARWLAGILGDSAGREFAVQPVVAFPGWFVEPELERGAVCILEPKRFPAYIKRQPAVLSYDDVRLAAFHLSRFIRSENKAPK